MRPAIKSLLVFLAIFVILLLLHLPLLCLPYFWDEAGYYIPAALDFYHSGLLIPATTLPTGHTPLVPVYLGLVWHLLGCSIWTARAAMALIAAAAVATLYALGRRVGTREVAVWSALLLAVSPLFFAQTTLAHLDLTAALFTILAVLFLLGEQFWLFALAASLAVLSKETAVVLLPVAWLYAGWRRRDPAIRRPALLSIWVPLLTPLLPLAAWALYYHHATGFWTGNRDYLSYNLYSTLSVPRVFWSLLRRAYELFVSGFNWLLTAGAVAGWWWQKHGTRGTGRGVRDTDTGYANPHPGPRTPYAEFRIPHFAFLTAGLVAVYLLLLSLVGGAILPRYLLPVLPLFYLGTVLLVMHLPRTPARIILATALFGFIGAWFTNPPYPFPYEDNLAYADFIRLHEQAARWLERQPGQPRILTAWPATDELSKPSLGYVRASLSVVPVPGFAPREFAGVAPDSFDLVYLYSRRWEPAGNWVARFPAWLRIQGRYFDYHPQVDASVLIDQYHLRLAAQLELRGQWVQIYARTSQ